MVDTLDKTVVALLLEAAKGALSHLSELKMALAEAERPPAGADEHTALQLYSRVRRIREYLRRAMSAYPMPQVLDLSEDDFNLLCSCMVFELNRAEKENTVQGMREGRDAEWFETRKEILTRWTMLLATRPIEHLPTLWSRLDLSYAARNLVAAVREKTTDPPPKPKDNPEAFQRFGNKPGEARQAEAAAGAATPQTPAETAVLPERATNLVDTSRIQDYRLRLTMVLDIRAYQRCVDGEDYRLAIVLLAMILEGVLVDHGLTNSVELGLEGAPRNWNLEAIAAAILGPEYGDRERASFALLQRAQGLLRPTTQLDEPIAVNKAMLQPVESLVRKIADTIGALTGSPKSTGTWSINWES